MTSEEWIANIASEQDRKYAREAVNAALEKERAGEIIVASGEMTVAGGYAQDTDILYADEENVDFTKTIHRKRGSLIFREEGK